MDINRRRFLGLAGLAAASVTGLSACGSNTGRPSSEGSATAGGDLPQLSQWYHEYGEDGVEDAVKRYAAAYPDATVTVKWNPGDYDKLVSAALLTADKVDHLQFLQLYAIYTKTHLEVFAASLSDVFLLTAATTALAAVLALTLRSGPQHHDPDAPALLD